MSTPEDLARSLEESRELLRMLNEQVEYLAQENERLRAELGRLPELQAVIARVNQDNDRLRAERDELLAAFLWRTWWNKYVTRAVAAGRGKQIGVYVERRGSVEVAAGAERSES